MLRRFLLKKKKGESQYLIVSVLFVFLILNVTIIQLEARKLLSMRQKCDNAITNSLLYANVCDLGALFAANELVYKGPTEEAILMDIFTDTTDNFVKSQEIAKQEFVKAFKENAQMDYSGNVFTPINKKTGIEKIELVNFYLYYSLWDEASQKEKIYLCDGVSNKPVFKGFLNEARFGENSDEEKITCSSLYVEMKVTYSFYGKTYGGEDSPIVLKKHVGIK